jgi:hypothetical protein
MRYDATLGIGGTPSDPNKAVTNQAGRAQFTADQRRRTIANLVAYFLRLYPNFTAEALATAVAKADPTLLLLGQSWDNWIREVSNICEAKMSVEDSAPAVPVVPPAFVLFESAYFGMVGDEWHGPSPPGEGWVEIGQGPRGGKRWRKTQAAEAPAPSGTGKKESTSSVPGYPKPAAKNGRDPDASGLPARGTHAKLYKPWAPDERAAAIGKILKDVGGGQPGNWTQANATTMEKVFAEVLNFDWWGETFPADIAGVVRVGDVSHRVGVDLKTAITQSAGRIKRDDNAELQKINFTIEDFDAAASGGAEASLMFFLAVNANHTVKQVPGVDPATGRARKDAQGRPVMKKAALLYLERGVRGGQYKDMTPIDVEGLENVSDLTNPAILARTREKILSLIRNTDPAQFAAQVKTSGEKLYQRTTKHRARDLDTLATAGVQINDQDQALRTAGHALNKADKADKALREERRKLKKLRDAAAADADLAAKLKALGIEL